MVCHGDAQHAQLVVVVNPVAQIQLAQQACFGTALPLGSEQAGLRSAKVL